MSADSYTPTANSVLARCKSCRTINRVPVSKLAAAPKCGKCRAELQFPSRPVEVTDANFRLEVLEEPGAVLIFFWAPWCAHCRGMFPALEDIARQKAGILKIGTVNTEKEKYLASTFSIMSVPRLTLYKHGKMIDEINGALPRPQLEEWITFQMSR